MLRKDLPRPYHPSEDPAETAKFNAMAQEWRNPHGRYKVIHAFHAARLAWLLPVLNLPHGATVLDVGCATGLASEAFARAGAVVTGVDLSARNIALAQACAAKAGLPITYRLAAPEEIATTTPHTYHAVLALEVVEHVADVDAFLNALFTCVHPQGCVVLATLNRTWASWLLGIVVAEYILRWLPRGTHSWQRFVTPAQLDSAARRHGFTCTAATGLMFNPFRWRWQPCRSLAVNYMRVYRKQV